MNPHILHHGIAAAIAGLIALAAVKLVPPVEITHRVTEQLNHTVNASKHAWPDLTDAQRVGLAGTLKVLAQGGAPGVPAPDAAVIKPQPLKLEIICSDGACTDLAQDIDDAAELAGVDSILDRPAFAMGYGLGVFAEAGDPRAKPLADALAAVTGQKVEVHATNTRASGYPLWIEIGKFPRKK